MNNKSILCCFVIFVGLINGCFHDKSNDKKKESRITELEGAWQTDCHYHPDRDEYQIQKIVFKKEKFTFINFISSDADCSMSIFSARETGTFLIGNNIIISSGVTVNEVDKLPEASFVTPLSEETAENFRTELLCDYPEWQNNIEIQVSKCVNKVYYDIFSIDGSILYFGDKITVEINSPTERPTQLQDVFYRKL